MNSTPIDLASMQSCNPQVLFQLSAGMCIVLFLGGHSLGEESPVGHAFLQEHCTHCHDRGSTEGGLNLKDLTLDPSDPVKLATWAKVFDRIVAGEMPPEGEERPGDQAVANFTRITSAALRDTWKERYAKRGRVGGRRLNPVEYETTLRDLLAAPWLELKEMLPPDPEAHGFDNVADAQDISYVQLARYLEAAEVAARIGKSDSAASTKGPNGHGSGNNPTALRHRDGFVTNHNEYPDGTDFVSAAAPLCGIKASCCLPRKDKSRG